MDFRFELENALREQSPAEMTEMLKNLSIERADVAAFVAGRCSLEPREIQQLLTHLGYRLER